MEEDRGITCLNCAEKLSSYNKSTDTHNPKPELMHKMGHVAVPNCGWFCNQQCAREFEIKCNVKFDKDENGIINYYK